ncbi:MAG: sigma-54-dependent Fis family transcriptional regulator [Candidatus Riflebacteria bacterium]|nr:sigma-54-dependent Fis family transcriptional regulator [Candidatus Riflebacteria bacterium]
MKIQKSEKFNILTVDDEDSVLYTLNAVLKMDGYFIEGAKSGEEAYKLFKTNTYDLVITDLTMQGMSGLELLELILKDDPQALVIIITAYGSESIAVEAMKKGAYDYLPKPFSNDDLRLTVKRALEKKQLERENKALREKLGRGTGQKTMTGSSEKMLEIYDMIGKVAPNDVTVLITGESGTGKELVAKALHEGSSRKDMPFVKVNCAALPENLIESELFGYEKGAFTGAMARKEGKFKVADKGTIFLDEIAEMNMQTQTKLLRVLQEREFERVGGNTLIKVDTRVIAATNRNLPEAILAGEFREDLYYRLNIINIQLPPLRERAADIPALVETFVKRFSEKFEKKPMEFKKSTIEALMRHDWPGNVRELENLIEKVVVLDDEEICIKDLEHNRLHRNNVAETNRYNIEMEYKDAKSELLSDFDYEYFKNLMEKSDGNISEAARMAGMHRRNLYTKLKELGLSREDFSG